MDANVRLDADKIELAKAILSITSKEVLEKVKSRLTDILDFQEKDEKKLTGGIDIWLQINI